MRKFFSYTGDYDSGFQTHETEEEAKSAVADALAEYESFANSDGWPEDIDLICWGRISEIATVASRSADPTGQWDEIVEYELKEVEE